MAKVKLNLSLEEDTAERLKQYAYEHHMTASQAVTEWIWAQKVKGENLRGQISLPKEGKMMTDRELYNSIGDELKADIRAVISDRTKLMEVARKHGLICRRGGKEHAKANLLTMIKVVENVEAQ